MHAVSRNTAVGCAIACALATLHCTAASTNVTAPSGDKCETTVSNAPSSFTADGGAGSLNINTERDCTWSITSEANWVSISAPRNGQGEAVVTYTVAPNPVPSARSGAIVAAGTRLQLSQAAAPCRFELSRTGDTVGAAGGTTTINVETLTGCGWTAASAVPWITVTSGASGNASGSVAMAIAANTGPARTGQVNVAGHTYTVSQAAASAAPPSPPSPSPPSPGPGGPAPPPPTPPSDPGDAVKLDGRVFALMGRCPDITFWVDGRLVVAGATTEYRRGNCGHLSNGDRVEVDGVRRPTGIVDALRISIRDDEDNDRDDDDGDDD